MMSIGSVLPRRAWVTIGAAGFISGLLTMVPAFATSAIINKVLPAPAYTMPTLIGIVALVGIAIVTNLTLNEARSRIVAKVTEEAERTLSGRLARHLLGAEVADLPQSHQAVILLRELSTIVEFEAALAGLGPQILNGVLIAVVVALVAGPLVVVPLVFGLVMILLSWRNAVVQRREVAAQVKHGGNRQRDIQEAVAGIRTLKLLGAEETFAGRLDQESAATASSSRRIRKAGARLQSFAAALGPSAQIGVYAAGVPLIAGGALDAGLLFAVGLLSGSVMAPFLQASHLIQQWQRANTARTMLQPILNARQEVQEGQVDASDLDGSITLERVSFRYPGTSINVLHDVDLSLSAGGSMLLEGPRGSGKSTVLDLLARIHQIDGERTGSGRVLIGGRDIRHLTPEALRSVVGVVPQKPVLFSGRTIMDNIRMARPEATDQEVIEAARMAVADDWIRLLPLGYATPVYEQGAHFSGGQVQSLALSRLFLRDPRIAALDEPTAAYDTEAEAELVRRSAPWFRGRTTVIISHRPALRALARYVIPLRDGRIVKDKIIDQQAQPNIITLPRSGAAQAAVAAS